MPVDEQVNATVRAHWALAAADLLELISGHASVRAPDGERMHGQTR